MLSQISPNGDETMIQDNANYPLSIWCEIDNIDQEYDLNLDYSVNGTGIYRIDVNGYLEQIPIYRVV
jgi:hypothetical protein